MLAALIKCCHGREQGHIVQHGCWGPWLWKKGRLWKASSWTGQTLQVDPLRGRTEQTWSSFSTRGPLIVPLCSIPVPPLPAVEGNASVESVTVGLGREDGGLAPGHRHMTTLGTTLSPPDTVHKQQGAQPGYHQLGSWENLRAEYQANSSSIEHQEMLPWKCDFFKHKLMELKLQGNFTHPWSHSVFFVPSSSSFCPNAPRILHSFRKYKQHFVFHVM